PALRETRARDRGRPRGRRRDGCHPRHGGRHGRRTPHTAHPAHTAARPPPPRSAGAAPTPGDPIGDTPPRAEREAFGAPSLPPLHARARVREIGTARWTTGKQRREWARRPPASAGAAR